MMPEQQQRILGYFIEEAKDHLNTIEQGLLNLQATIQDREMMNEVFRAAHSVKGGAAMLSLNSIQLTSHRLEDYFKILKEAPSTQVDRTLESMFLQVFDGLQALLEELQGPFGLTEDKAQEVMADVEPVFDRLEAHLNTLVETTATPAAAPAAPVAPAVQKVPALATEREDSALKLVFTSDIPSHLREMLTLFKQADSASSRAALQTCCETLKRSGEQFDLTAWCALTAAASKAVGNPEQTYRSLAPIVIKELKRAQEQVLSGQAETIAVSAELTSLMPVMIEAEAPLEAMDALLEDTQAAPADSDFADLFETEAPPATAAEADLDWLDLSGSEADSVDLDSDDLTTSLEAFSNPESSVSDDAITSREPVVGAAELNSLADLFEGEVSELDSPWEEISESEAAIAEDPNPDIDISDDFSDLLGGALDEEASETQTDLTDLFGDTTGLEATAETTTAASNVEDDLDDLLNLEASTAPAADINGTEVALGDDEDDGLDAFLDSFSEASDNEAAELEDIPATVIEDALSADAFEIALADPGTDRDLEAGEILSNLDEPSVSSAEGAVVESSDDSFDAISDPWSSEEPAEDIPAEDALDALDELWTEARPEEESTAAPPAATVRSDTHDFDEFADLDLTADATDASASDDFDDFTDLGLNAESEATIDLGAAAPEIDLDELGFDAEATGETDLDDLFDPASDAGEALSTIANEDETADTELSDIFADTPTNDDALTAEVEGDLTDLFGESGESSESDVSESDVAAIDNFETEGDFGGLFDDEAADADSEATSDPDLSELMGEAIIGDPEILDAGSDELADLSLFDATADNTSPVEQDDLADLSLFDTDIAADSALFESEETEATPNLAEDLIFTAEEAPAAETDLDSLNAIGANDNDLDALLNADDKSATDDAAISLDEVAFDEAALGETATDEAAALDLTFAETDDNDLGLDAPTDEFDSLLSEPETGVPEPGIGEAIQDLTEELSLEEADAAIALSDETAEESFFDSEPAPLTEPSAVKEGSTPEDDIEDFFATPTATPESPADSNDFDDFMSDHESTDASSELDFLAVESSVSDEANVTTAESDAGLDALMDVGESTDDTHELDLSALDNPVSDEANVAPAALDDGLDALMGVGEPTDTSDELDFLADDNAATNEFDLTPSDEQADADSLFGIDDLGAAAPMTEADPLDSLLSDDLEDAVGSADLFDASSTDEVSVDQLESSLSDVGDVLSVDAVLDESDALATEITDAADDRLDVGDSNDFGDAEDLADLDALLDEAPAAADAGEDADLDGLDALLDDAPAADDVGANESDLADLDALLDEAPTDTDASIEAENFDGLDALLDDVPPDSTTSTDTTDFDGLDALLDEAPPDSQTAAGFDELDDLLGADTPSDATDAGAGTVDFDELDALIGDDSTANLTETSGPDATTDDDFGDLEKLLEEADQALGGPSASIRSTSTRRAPRRVGGIVDQTMRVSVKHLDNLNNLVGELVVNRNSLEQDQDRFRQFLDYLMIQVQLLNDVGQRMRDLYERSLLESSLLASRQAFQSGGLTPAPRHGGNGDGHATGASFDALEMDRFTGFHTLTQEMIELIVRVRESSSDIAYTVESTDQIARQFRQVTTQLQEGLNKARMVPFAQTADRLPRAVRDISIKCGKEARLVVEGRDTLIDKMLLERLYDPMTHLVNNAITHGIEPPEERAAVGKPREGKITVRAFYQGNQTVIYIEDDGGGINPSVVKSKAIQRGIITQADADSMDTLETYELLFRHGFSTRDRADDFAGRGVGMDVVRTALAEIRGSITIDSEMGKGTSFTIRLPLTLSISKALSCLNNQARIAFPMDGVEDMFDVPRERVQTDDEGQNAIQWRDMLLSFQPLSELLHFNRALGRGRVYGGSQDDNMVSIVVLRNANTYIGIEVDRVLGEQEIVIKQIEGPVPKPMGIAGATVLGDGRVMPIGDVLELIDIAQGRVRREAGSSIWSQIELPPEETVVAKAEPTVLIVDDSITVRELLSMSFNKVGYRVEQARDGQEAWEKMRSGLPCDLVFCDIEMPRMDGLELLSRMQKDSALKQIPIAMLTSRGADRHRQMAVDLGASGYFTKPYLEEALLDAAQRMLHGEVLLVGAEAEAEEAP
ncbi:MAG: response regulator [Leptolyngbyaceae cyanobacterium]